MQHFAFNWQNLLAIFFEKFTSETSKNFFNCRIRGHKHFPLSTLATNLKIFFLSSVAEFGARQTGINGLKKCLPGQ
jgi:hypothetical protein